MQAVPARLTIADLRPEQIAKFSWWRCDQFYEKHESWGNWGDDLKYHSGQFIEVAGQPVLLPHLPDDLTNLLVDDYNLSDDGRVMNLFLRDYTYLENPQNPNKWDIASSGYVAICYRPEGEEFYVAVLYHARYIVPAPMRNSPGSEWYTSN